MNLLNNLESAGDALLALLDPEKNLMPTGGYEVAHDLGRWWDAVLRLEDKTSFIIPTELETASLQNLELLTGNPDGLLMNNPSIPWLKEKAKINPHNFRETLLAFGGLIKSRNSLWARKTGLHLVEVMDRSLQADGSFDFTKLGSWGQVPHTQDPSHTEAKREGWFDGTATSGRSLEALVWLFQTTNEPPVMDVARRIAEHHLEYSTNSNGTVREEIVSPDNVGHNHSYHGTLRGLLLFGLLTDEKKYVDVVEATYRNAIRNTIVKESGWTPHDLGKLRFPNDYGDPVADPASTGDAAQLALWLGLHAGCHDLLDDVERYVRSRLILAQLTKEDIRRNPEQKFTSRDIGAWSIHGPSHGGKGCTPDVLAAVTHSLCDIHSNICTKEQGRLCVNLHFDYEDSKLKIRSIRNQGAKLSVRIKQPDNIMIRIPGWTTDTSLKLTVNEKSFPVERLGKFAWISRDVLNENSRIIMSYDLPTKTTKEKMVSGRCYTFDWRGDEIVGIDPQDNPLPFYPALENNSKR